MNQSKGEGREERAVAIDGSTHHHRKDLPSTEARGILETSLAVLIVLAPLLPLLLVIVPLLLDDAHDAIKHADIFRVIKHVLLGEYALQPVIQCFVGCCRW